jgi:methionyl-tRNA formyltransferase
VSRLRVVFMGTPDFAAASLAALTACPELSIPLVVCQSDKPKGRSSEPQPPPVKVLAARLGLAVYQPKSLRKGDAAEVIAAAEPDLIVVAAYGKILPAAILALPRLGCLNVHASLLPELRGASPIQWAIVSGLARSGISIMKMDEGLDTGPVLTRAETPIGPSDDADALHDRLMALGAELLVPTLLAWSRGEVIPEPQDAARATYAPLLSRDSGRVDWTWSAARLANLVRGLHPWPGSFTHWQGKLLKLFPPALAAPGPTGAAPGTIVAVDRDAIEVACGDGSLGFGELQLEGRKRLPVDAFLNGCALRPGERLTAFSAPEA